LVQQGLPFREAHHVVGALVRQAEERGVQLGQLPPDVLEAAHASLTGAGLSSALDPAAAVERRSLIGGPAKATVTRAIAHARKVWSE
jgi:argininosuccinate lyase